MPGYPQVLKYYMWPWQVHYRISCQTNAESLFNQLDRGLQPNVFLIGFLTKDRKDRLPKCIEPEELHYFINDFDKIDAIAANLYEIDEGRQMLYSGPGMQEEMDSRLKKKTFRLAIEKILNESKNNSDKICFASSAVVVEDYNVYVILELNKNVYQSHFHLHKVDPEERVKIYYSLLETAKDAFLSDRFLQLNLPDPGKNLSGDSRSSEELLREAAKSFMYTISWAGKNGQGIHGLFDACNKISISRYEGSESNGHIIIAKKNHPEIEMTLELEAPFSIHDYRKTRKFLQLSNIETGVLCDSYDIWGLGKIKRSYNTLSESIFNIHFNSIHCWDVMHGNKVLMQLRYGLPQFPQEVINKEKFFSDAKRIFSEISSENIEILFTLSIAATTQKKGAMLIISKEAQKEAHRLSKQCITIKPIMLNPELIINLTSIDGGVLLDITGVAYAQGVILDGIVGYKGNAARGSRYNSALTYQEYKGLDHPTMVVVVSEDGMVDVVPTLMPQIRHSEINQVIRILEQISTESTFDRRVFYKMMEWLKNRQFYLMSEECKKINILKRTLEELDKTVSEQTMWIVHEDFFSNPEMNHTYYLPEN